MPFVTDEAEVLFDGINIHGISLKEEHKITARTSGQVKFNLALRKKRS
ncbi:hypothetical protein VCHA29O37_580008 [Vibrio chagasii]|nr:hypothetical protein VCHA29O37_580008 [Vibrio chagasii]